VIRVETKIFAFSRKFIFFCENFQTKITKTFTKIFASRYGSSSDQMMRLHLRLRNIAFFFISQKNFVKKIKLIFETIFAKICVFFIAKMLRDFCEHFRLFSFPRKFSQKFTTFSRKFLGKSEFFVFAKISRYFRENIRENQSFCFRKNYSRFSQIFAKTKYFCETKFRKISRISAHFCMILAFSRKLKNAFSFQPYL
jgi:hypothetical protein